jgi:diguanylate cyclase (GGDEF)-like protein/PAS domain S-box-containing protein
MAVKPKASVKSKTASKPKAVTKPNKKISSKKSEFSRLAEDIISNISVGIYIVQKGKFVYTSPLFEKLSGYSNADLAGTSSLDYIHPDDKEIVRNKAIKSLKGKSSGAYEYRFTRKNGEVIWVLEMVTSIVFNAERASLVSFMDITERKKVEETIHQSEEKYRTILDEMEDAYFEVDLAGNFTFVNDAISRHLGYSREELIGASFRGQIAKEEFEKVYKAFGKIYITGKPERDIHYKIIRKDGTTGFAEMTGFPLKNQKGEVICFRGVGRDITERRQMEKALQQSEEKHRNIIKNIQDGYFEVDLAGNFTFFNESICEIQGYSKEELMGMNHRQYADKENSKKVFEAFNKIYKTGITGSIFEYEIIRKDGTRRQVEVSASLIKDSSGKPTGFRGTTRDVTERKRIEESLRQNEEKYRTILENIEDGYYEVDINGDFTFFNDSMCVLLGYSRDEMVRMNNRQYTDKENAKKLFQTFNEVYRTGKPAKAFDWQIIRKDGTKRSIEASISLLKDLSGNAIGFRGITRDATERKQAEETIRQSEERYRTILDEMEDGYMELDIAGNFTFVNDASCRHSGYSREEMVGTSFKSHMDKEEFENMYKTFGNIYMTGKPERNIFYKLLRKDGTTAFAELAGFPLKNQKGEVTGFRAVGRDISARKQMEEAIQYQATHDALTGLANRLMFGQMLNHAIQSAKRHQRQLAVLFIDLDRFKTINDTLGHEAGDQLLQEIAARLKQTLRAADLISRMGGDEFVIMIEEASDASQIATVAHKILTSIIQPVTIMKQECRITASIGICLYPKDADDEQTLMKNADIAMYLAKEEGKNNYQFYAEDIQSKSLERLSIETNLRSALERNELSLHYQAKVDFKTNTINGVEALLRWQNSSLGLVTPTQFIPVAEETGLIVPIGNWVLKTACAQNVAWQKQGLPPVCIAVNLSVRQLTDENLIDDIRTALTDSGMAPKLLELEITESMMMRNPERMIAVLARIKSLGVRLAIDDFGTGYSSLAQIKHFPVDTLKVDRSFIRNIPQDSEDKAITEAIIAMGKTLSLTVVAEGVETLDQMNFLKDHSCDEMQGYYFSKPIAPEQFADLLRKHVPVPER